VHISAAGWALLAGAVASEVTATSLLPRTHGFARPGWSAIVLGGYGLAFFFLSRSLTYVPLSVTYAIWSGVGTTIIAIVGVLALGESMSPAKAAGLALVVGGVVLLNLA
jgi:small multidrug resistance pump